MDAFTYNRTVPLSEMFMPDPRLFRPDADLSLIFLSGNGMSFLEPTDDPWYRGSIPWTNITQTGYNKTGDWKKTVYRPDEAASPMGCIQQYQYCNAEHKCGQLASFYDAMTTAAPFLNTSMEQIGGYTNVSGQASSQFNWFEQIIYAGLDLPKLVRFLGSAALASRRSFEVGYFAQISNDQWKLDVIHWWNTLLASRQAAFVSTAHGPGDTSLLSNTILPQNEYMVHLCRNQVRLVTLWSLIGDNI